jgi:pheromone a factor receptor
MKRRLYFLVLSIIVPFTPVSILLSVLNYINVGPLLPFSYSAIHDHQEPYPWNTITYVTSDSLDFAVLNNAYIPILSCVPVFIFFGMTADAINDYRKCLLAVGLGCFFPKLYQEFAFDRGLYSNNSLGYSNTAVSAG